MSQVTRIGVERELELVVERDHPNPHHVLGAHAADGGVVDPRLPTRRDRGPRAPRGRRRRSSSSGSTRPASSRATSAAPRLPLRYRLEVDVPGREHLRRSTTRTGSCRRSASSTSTSPARGATRSCTRSSARTCASMDGTAGTAFAVWAPAARSVSVVGDFNGWDGRLHPMRSLGSVGIWELFVPGLEPGTQLQVRDPRAERRAPAQGRPVRVRDRGAAEERVRRLPARARLGRRGLARAARRPPTCGAARCRSTRCTSAPGG